MAAGRSAKTTATAAAQKPKQQVQQKGKGKGKKEKEPRYTPSEYAKVIQAQMAELQKNGTKGKGKVVPFLKGKRIYFHGGDLNMAGESTRKRMKLVRIRLLAALRSARIMTDWYSFRVGIVDGGWWVVRSSNMEASFFPSSTRRGRRISSVTIWRVARS